ncbi:histone-lysine N-methyltransferase SETMAR [Trichonephila clavipes]|nr:histone-lysine N-methyltransferase SETMAR [Trichonephila clavipes]
MVQNDEVRVAERCDVNIHSLTLEALGTSYDPMGYRGRERERRENVSTVRLLPDNKMINSEVYCHQLDKLNDALQQKKSELINRKDVVFHQDNVRPHTSLVTRQKLLQLEWDTMPHPPYSPDLAPSDYYLFQSL